MAGSSVASHVVVRRRSLRQWSQQSALVAVADVLTPIQIWSAADGSDHQEYFTIRVFETVAGAWLVGKRGAEVDVFAHAEGQPRIRVGDRMMVFLDRSADHPEFAQLAKHFPYFTSQGAGDEWKVDGDDPVLPGIVREWRELRNGETYVALRTLVLRELAVKNARIRGDGIGELLRLRGRNEFSRRSRPSPAYSRHAGECENTDNLTGRAHPFGESCHHQGDGRFAWLCRR